MPKRLCNRVLLTTPLLIYVVPALVQAQAITFDGQVQSPRVGAPFPTPVRVRVANAAGQPVSGTIVDIELASGPAGATLSPAPARATTGSDGVAVFDDLSIDQIGTGFTFSASATVGTAAVSAISPVFAVAATPSVGRDVQLIFALRLPAGICHPDPGSNPCEPNGELLPLGDDNVFGGWWYSVSGIFDTGGNHVIVGLNDHDFLDLCGATGGCQTPAPPATPPDPDVPSQLELWIAGLGETDPDNGNRVTGGWPQFASSGVKVVPNAIVPTLIGTPVAGASVAHVDFTSTVSRYFSFLDSTITHTSVTFFPPTHPDIPSLELEFELARFGVSTPNPVLGNATRAPRYHLKGVTLVNGANSVDDASFNFLFDTGANSSVVNEDVAAALGLDPATPHHEMTVNTVSGTVQYLGYVIDRAVLTGVGGVRPYTLDDALIYVAPAPPTGVANTFQGDVQAIIGTNYFDRTRFVFDGPGDLLRVPRRMSLLAPTPGTPTQGGSPTAGRRVLVRLESELPGLGLIAGDLAVTVGGDPATVVTESDVAGEHWMVVDVPAEATGCYDLLLTHSRDPQTTSVGAQSVCYDADQVFDRVLAIDRTHSMDYDGNTGMQTAEKMDAARAAARFFVNYASDADSIGVISFKRDADDGDGVVEQDELARVDFAMDVAQDGTTDNRGAANAAIDGIAPDPPGFRYETSIGAGINASWDMLKDPNQGSPDHEWEIVVLSDGKENFPPYWMTDPNPLRDEVLAASKPIRIHSVAIGPGADLEILEDMANSTGGLFWSLYEGTASFGLMSRLASVYKEIDEGIRGEQRFYYREHTPGQGDPPASDTTGSFMVEPGLQRMSVGFHWNVDYAISVQLVDPSGTVVGTGYPDGSSRSDRLHVAHQIRDPIPGLWRYNMLAYPRRLKHPQQSFEFFAAASGDSDLLFEIGPRSVTRFGGTFQVPLRIVLADDAPIAGASVTADVRRVDGLHTLVQLRDDGLSDDGGPDDGIYGAVFSDQMPGPYLVQIEVDGTRSDGVDFFRLASFSFVFPSEEPDGQGPIEPTPQERPDSSRVRYGVFVGSSHPLHSFSAENDANVLGRASLDVRVLQNIAVRLSVGLNQFTAESSSGARHPRWTDVSLNAVYYLPPIPGAREYLMFGPARYVPKTGTQRSGFNVGFGVEIPATNQWSIDFGGRYHFVFADPDFRFVSLRFGVMKR